MHRKWFEDAPDATEDADTLSELSPTTSEKESESLPCADGRGDVHGSGKKKGLETPIKI